MHWYNEDEVLLAELGQALRPEPLPGVDAALTAARSAAMPPRGAR
jgi:hypothetical protein